MKIISRSGFNSQVAMATKPHCTDWELNWNRLAHGLIKYRPSIAIVRFKKLKSKRVLHMKNRWIMLAVLFTVRTVMGIQFQSIILVIFRTIQTRFKPILIE